MLYQLEPYYNTVENSNPDRVYSPSALLGSYFAEITAAVIMLYHSEFKLALS